MIPSDTLVLGDLIRLHDDSERWWIVHGTHQDGRKLLRAAAKPHDTKLVKLAAMMPEANVTRSADIAAQEFRCETDA